MYLENPFTLGVAIVARPKLSGLGEHWGVQLPDGRVAHCTPDRGEHISTYTEFAAGFQVRTKRNVPTQLQWEAVERVMGALRQPKTYHPTINNCEIFANKMIGVKPDSPTVNGLVVVALVAVVLRVAA